MDDGIESYPRMTPLNRSSSSLPLSTISGLGGILCKRLRPFVGPTPCLTADSQCQPGSAAGATAPQALSDTAPRAPSDCFRRPCLLQSTFRGLVAARTL